MFRWVILLSLLLGFETAHAHQPDISSTMLVEQGENQWVLQIRASLTAFQYEIKYHFGDSAYATPEEFMQLVLNHVKENTAIQFNDAHVSLDSGMVRLGHETNVVFKVSGTPEDIKSLAVQNSSFKDISRNQSALILFKEGFEKEQFILNKENEHAIKLKVVDSKFVIDTPSEKKDNTLILVSFFVIIGFLTGLYFYKKKGRSQVESIGIDV